MSEEIFRKKNLDKVKSPESLNDYIHVTNPGVWIVLVSAIILLVGACVWGVFGKVESKIDTAVTVENGKAICFVSDEDYSSVSVGMTVEFNDCKGKISSLSTQKINGEFSCEVTVDKDIESGTFPGKIVVNAVSPISFVLN